MIKVKRKKIIIASVVCFVVALTIILSVSLTVGSFENRFIKTMTNLNYNIITSSKRFYFENCTSYCTFNAAGMFALFLLSGRYLERRARERTAAEIGRASCRERV